MAAQRLASRGRYWTDSNRNPESAISRDAMLDDIMLYWLTGTAA